MFDRLLSDLSISQAAESEARARLAEAEARKAEAEAAFGKAQTEAIERREAQQLLAAEDVLDGLRATVLGALRPRAGSGEGWVRSIGAAVVKAAEFVGRPDLAANVPALRRAADNANEATAALQTRIGDLEDILNEARASARQGSSMLAWLANARFSEADRSRLVVRTAGFFAVFLVLALLLQAWGGQIAGWIGAGAALIAPNSGCTRHHHRLGAPQPVGRLASLCVPGERAGSHRGGKGRTAVAPRGCTAGGTPRGERGRGGRCATARGSGGGGSRPEDPRGGGEIRVLGRADEALHRGPAGGW